MPRAKVSLAEQAAARSQDSGRGFHVRVILRIFRRRGLGWAEFGLWLHDLFHDVSSPLYLEMQTDCRHYCVPLEQRDQYLQPLAVDPFGVADWNTVGDYLQSRGIRPCSTAGGWEYSINKGGRGEGKATYVSVVRVRAHARAWANRRVKEAPMLHIQAEENKESQETDSFYESLTAGTDMQDIASDIQDEDPESLQHSPQILSAWRSPASSNVASTVIGQSLSAKMRTHVWAVLAKYYQEVEQLADNTYRIVNGTESVLHLCGCGLCGPAPAKRRSCCEPSHLVLGDGALNLKHAHWHEALGLLAKHGLVGSYVKLRQAILYEHRELPDELVDVI